MDQFSQYVTAPYSANRRSNPQEFEEGIRCFPIYSYMHDIYIYIGLFKRICFDLGHVLSSHVTGWGFHALGMPCRGRTYKAPVRCRWRLGAGRVVGRAGCRCERRSSLHHLVVLQLNMEKTHTKCWEDDGRNGERCEFPVCFGWASDFGCSDVAVTLGDAR